MQKTIRKEVVINGIGLHSGSEVVMRVRPTSPDTGIVFVRTDVTDRDNQVSALWSHVVDTRLCTVVGNKAGVTVGTIEHLMAALSGMGINNAIVELDGPEVPIMDGSSELFMEAFEAVGVMKQAAPLRAIKILKDVVVRDGDKEVSYAPADQMIFEGEIDFSHDSIGRQSMTMVLENGSFRGELSDARTFGFVHEVEALRKMGLCLGGSVENAVVLDQDKILNEEGLRSENEFIRHKLLDSVGDVYLAGAPIIGHYKGYKCGHAINNAVLHEIFADQSNWCWVECDERGMPIESNSSEMLDAA